MAALPYMQLYVADYLADTAHLSTVEHGAYLLLIFNYWQRGESFKARDEQTLNRRLASVARLSNEEWMSVRENLAEFFDVTETEWAHHRIDRDIEVVNAKSNQASMAGKASAKRRANERSTDVERTLNHTEADTETDSKPTSSLRSEGEQVVASPKADQENLFDEPEPLKAEPQSDDSLVSAIFAEGLPLMLEAKVSEKSARSLLGRLRGKLGDLEAVVVIEAMRREKPLDPSAWLSKVINARQDTRQTFAEWAADCKARGEKLIAGYQPVLDYCEGIDLPNELMNLAWSEFKRQHFEGGIYADKRSDNWRAAFRIGLERGYMRLWYWDKAANAWCLTTQGLQAQAITEAKERAAA